MVCVANEARIRNRHTDCVTVCRLDRNRPLSDDADELARLNDKYALLEFA